MRKLLAILLLLVSVASAEPQVVMNVNPVTFPPHGDADVVVSLALNGGCQAIGFNFGMHWNSASLRYVSGTLSCPGACPDQWQLSDTHIDSIASIIAYSFPGFNPLHDGIVLRMHMHNNADAPISACNRGLWFQDFQAGCVLGGLTTGVAPISCAPTDVEVMPPVRKTWSIAKELYR